MSRPVPPRRRSGVPAFVLVAAVLAVVALAVAFAAAGPRAATPTSVTTPAAVTMPPPEQAAVPHFIDVKAPGEPRTVVVGGMTDSLPGTSNEAGYLMTNLRAGAIPAGATNLTLTGSYRVMTEELFGSFDLAQIDLASTANSPFEVALAIDNGDDTDSWTPFTKTFGNAHGGETVRVRLSSASDDSARTNFFFDSLSLKATVTPSGCP